MATSVDGVKEPPRVMIRQTDGMFWDRQMEQVAGLETKAGMQEAIGWLDVERYSHSQHLESSHSGGYNSSVPRPPALAHLALVWLLFTWVISNCGAQAPKRAPRM